MNTAT